MTVTTAMIKDLREITGAGPLDCKKALEAHAGDFDKAADALREKGLSRSDKKSGRVTKAGLIIIKASESAICAVEVDCETDFVAFTENFKMFAHRVADQVLADAEITDAEKLLASDFIDSPGKTTGDVIRELIGKLDENIIVRRIARYPFDGSGVVEGYIHVGDIEGHYGPMEGRVGVLVELRAEAPVNHDLLQVLAHDIALHIAASHPIYLALDDIPAEIVRAERENLIAQVQSSDENKPDHIQMKMVEGRFTKLVQEVCLLKQAFVKDDSITIEQLLQQKSRETGATITVHQFARFEIGA